MNAAELAVAELRTTLENQSTRLTEIASEVRGLSLNNVLLSELITIPATGIVQRNVSAPYAAVGVWAYGSPVTVTSAAEAASAPPSGVGVLRVGSGGSAVWPLVGTTLTIYGTAGDQVLLALWSKPQSPLVATQTPGLGGWASGVVSYGIGATAILRPANSARFSITILNQGAGQVWLGPTNAVAAGAGFPLAAGGALTLETTAAIWVHAVAAADVAFAEQLRP